MTKIDIYGAVIRMTGGLSVSTPKVLKDILDALTTDVRFVPEKHSTHERMLDPFDYNEACKLAFGEPSQVNLYLRRKKAVAYEAILGQARRSRITFRFSPNHQKHWKAIFDLSDRIASAFEPDIGFSHLSSEAHALFPSNDAAVRLTNAMDSGTKIDARYWSNGVGGLGYRTYVGPFVIEQIGKNRLRSLPAPAVVTDTVWGGVRVDLVERPWENDQVTIRDSWTACMAHLQPSRWFATLALRKEESVDGGMKLIPPTHEGWSPGGVIRE